MAQAIRYKHVELKKEKYLTIQNEIRGGRVPPVLKLAREVAINAGLDPTECFATRVEVKAIDEAIAEYRLIAFYINDSEALDILYKSPKSQHPNIYIILKDNIFYPVPQVSYLVGSKYEKKNMWFCPSCIKWIPKKEHRTHNCLDLCSSCYTVECRERRGINNERIFCGICKRHFFNTFCLQKHTVNKICSFTQNCRGCGEIITGDKSKHRCGKVLCSFCFESYTPNNDIQHVCMMSAKKEKNQKEIKIFYDFESTTRGNFIPTALTSIKTCSECKSLLDETSQLSCLFCGNTPNIKKFVHSEDSPHSITKRFILYLLNIEKVVIQKYGVSKVKMNVYAHNGGRFDTHFIIQCLLEEFDGEECLLKTPPVMTGLNIMTIKISKIINFLDSRNLMPGALSKLPLTMGFSDKVKKGFFPYEFASIDNLDYEGVIPAKEFFNVKEDRREEFDRFYNERANVVYNLKDELLKYCLNDTFILAICFEKFCDLIKQKFDISVFEHITIAGLSLAIYMKHFSKKDTIPIIAEKRSRPDSHACSLWLKYEEKKDNISIRSASAHWSERICRVGRSGKIMYFDGFCEATNTVYLFHGCYYHGCIECGNNRKFVGGQSAEELQRKTRQDEERIINEGYKLIVMKECHWNILKQRQVNLVQTCEEDLEAGRLDPSEALYGGEN